MFRYTLIYDFYRYNIANVVNNINCHVYPHFVNVVFISQVHKNFSGGLKAILLIYFTIIYCAHEALLNFKVMFINIDTRNY